MNNINCLTRPSYLDELAATTIICGHNQELNKITTLNNSHSFECCDKSNALKNLADFELKNDVNHSSNSIINQNNKESCILTSTLNEEKSK